MDIRDNKIFNSETNRWVKADGVTGRKIIAAFHAQMAQK
jgi:hypothetical protein